MTSTGRDTPYLGQHCVEFAPVLPVLLDETQAGTPDYESAREHVASCARCHGQVQSLKQMDDRLAAYMASQAVTPLRMEDIMHTGSRPAPSFRQVDAPAQVQHPVRRYASHVAAVAAVLIVAALAAVIFGTHAFNPPATNSQQKTVSLKSVSSIVDISMVSPSEGWAVGDVSTPIVAVGKGQPPSAGTAVLTRANSPRSTGVILHLNDGGWTSVPVPLSADLKVRLSTVSMDSPTDGWIGGTVLYPPTATTNSPAVLLHFNGTNWQSVQARGLGAITRIQMISATNGYATVLDNSNSNPMLYHFDGSTWRQVSLPDPLAGPNRMLSVTDFSVLRDGQVWVSAIEDPTPGVDMSGSGTAVPVATAVAVAGSAGTPATVIDTPVAGGPGMLPTAIIFHYDGSTWSAQWMQQDTSISALSMGSSTAGWALVQYLGIDPSVPPVQSGTSGSADFPTASMLQYTGGGWHEVGVRVPISQMTSAPSVIAMGSATDGWMAGQVLASSSAQPGATAKPIPGFPPGKDFQISLFHFDGKQWTEVTAPVTPMGISTPTRLTMTGPGEGWLLGITNSWTTGPPSSGSPPEIHTTPVIMRLHNGVWSVVPFGS